MNAPRSSDARGKRILIDPIDDRISKLPDDVLVMILASLSTEDALKTSVLSTRWKNVWKQVPYLHFDLLSATYESGLIAALSNSVAESITQVSLHFSLFCSYEFPVKCFVFYLSRFP